MFAELLRKFGTQTRHALRQRVAARRAFAEPKWNARRRAVGIFNPHRAALDTHDLVGLIAELKHIARHAFDGEIFVDGADLNRLRLEHDVVVGGIGNRAAGGHRRQRRAATAMQHIVDGVAMDVGIATAAARGVSISEHAHDFQKFFTRDVAERIGAANQCKQIVLAPILQRYFGSDLLRQHIEGFVANHELIEFAALDRVEQCGAFH